MNPAGGNNMSLGGPSPVLHVRDNSQSNLDELFAVLNKAPGLPVQQQVPMKERKLPDSFFKPPSVPRPGSHSRESSADSTQGPYNVAPRAAPNPALQISHGRSRSSPAGLLQTLSAAPQPPPQPAPVPSHLKTQSFDISEVDNRPLPPGWEIATTPRGERYFLNHNDQTTSWEDPRKSLPASNITASQSHSTPQLPAAAAQAALNAATSGPLPPGWEQAATPDGEVYFINHNDKSTSWYDPRLPKQLQKIAIRGQNPAPPQHQHLSPPLPPAGGLSPGAVNVAAGGSPVHRGLPTSSPEPFQSRLQRLQQEKQLLLKRQQEIVKQEHELQNLMTSRVSSPPSTMSTSSDVAAVSTGVDPFLGQATPTEFHARQNSADSGLGGMGTSYSLSRTPDDFLGNVDEMETQEAGHKVTSLPSNEFGLDTMQGATSMDVGNLGDPASTDSQGPTGMDSDDLVPSLQEDISNELLSDMDGQKMENLLTWL